MNSVMKTFKIYTCYFYYSKLMIYTYFKCLDQRIVFKDLQGHNCTTESLARAVMLELRAKNGEFVTMLVVEVCRRKGHRFTPWAHTKSSQT